MHKLVRLACLVSLGCAIGCSPNVVDHGAQSGGAGGGGNAATGSRSGAGGGGGAGQGGDSPYPTPCSFLSGTATLTSWQGNQHDGSYQRSAFSFEFATHDENVTGNDYDLLYEDNVFIVNTVVDDKSFIVDLGDIALDAVPATIDAKAYPTGEFGAHDDIQAVVDHTYWVRTLDDDTRQVAAFRVTLLAPGEQATIAWMRSLDPDSFVAPVACP